MSNANLGDNATAVGFVHITKHNADGVLIYDQWFKNKLTNFARNASAQLWAGQSLPGGTPNNIQVGTGSPTPPLTGVDPSDTALWTAMPNTMKSCDFITVWLSYNTQYSVTYEQSEAIGNWTELALMDGAMNLWSHVQLTGVSKNSGETITVQWQIQHIGN